MTKETVLDAIRDLRNESELSKNVVDDIFQTVETEWMSVNSDFLECTKEYLDELMTHGVIDTFAWGYDDCEAFFNAYKEDISTLLYELMNDSGEPVHKLFGDKWDAFDPLALHRDNKALLGCFGYEEIAWQLQNELDSLDLDEVEETGDIREVA